MELSNDVEDGGPSGHLSSPNDASNAKNGSHLIEELLARNTPWNLQATKAIAKAINCSPQTDVTALLLKTTPIQTTQ